MPNKKQSPLQSYNFKPKLSKRDDFFGTIEKMSKIFLCLVNALPCKLKQTRSQWFERQYLVRQVLQLQGLHQILCFFRRFKNIPNSGLSLFSLGVSVCTHTRQVENQRCSRTGRVHKNHKILRKKHNV